MKYQIKLLFLILTTYCCNAQSANYTINQTIIDQIPNEVSILGLGDPTHQERTITNYRIDLIQKLVKQKGFNIIAIEGNLFELYRAHQNFLQDKDPTHYKNAMYRQLNAIEMEALYQFVLDQNQHGNPVLIIGFDAAFSGTTYSSEMKKQLEKSNILSDKEKKEFILYLNKGRITNLSALFRNNKKVAAKLLHYAEKIVSNFRPATLDEFVFVQTLNNLMMLYRTTNNSQKNQRDIVMADNIDFIKTQFPLGKIILFGSSTHLLKQPKQIDNAYFEDRITLGDALDQKYKNAYYFIAYDAISGFRYNFSSKKPRQISAPIEHSIEFLADSTFKNEAAIYLTKNEFPLENEKTQARILGYFYYPMNLWKVADALVMLRNVEPFKIETK